VGARQRIYIAGCGGMLGQAVHAACSAVAEVSASDLAPRAPWLAQLDVSDLDRFWQAVDAFRPDLVVNLAAQTDLERCERRPELARAANTEGAANGATVADRLGVPYVTISTAGIFDGRQEVYSDDDPAHPLTVYGATKLAGEEAARAIVAEHFVLRAGWMMGGGPALDKKFVNLIHRQLRAGARTLHAVTDKLGSPTYTHDFARVLLQVVRSGQYGTYNMVGEGPASRYDVALELVRLLGLADDVEVVPTTSEFFADAYFADRPRSEQLSNDRLRARGLGPMRPWREALADYAEEFAASPGPVTRTGRPRSPGTRTA
jgi:dTDP-4-dehydrorhamnose reductase